MSRPETRVLQTAAAPGALEANPFVPPIERMHMELAAGEIGANIIEHSARGRHVMMTMDVTVSLGQVQVEFTDDGDPVEVDIDAVRLPDDMAERGRGLALARSVLARLAYHRSEVNHWILVSKPFG